MCISFRGGLHTGFVGDSVVYAELGLDFHQILQRQLLRVKGRIALRWVVNAATNQIVI